MAKTSQSANPQMDIASDAVVESAIQNWPWLRGLWVSGAGYDAKGVQHRSRQSPGRDATILIYCAKGGGWGEIGGRIHPVRKGDLLVLPPRVPHAYGGHISQPWTIYWVHALGTNLPGYLREMGVDVRNPILRLGEDLAVMALLNEIRRDFKDLDPVKSLFHASHALGHLLSVIIKHRNGQTNAANSAVQKVAQSIDCMSERLSEPLKVSTLATLANLSAAHFAAIFKEQTGCSPHRYLHLLRMHRACQWLTGTDLSMKQIAAQLGYQDAFHFSRQFKRFSGMPPSAYRTVNPSAD